MTTESTNNPHRFSRRTFLKGLAISGGAVLTSAIEGAGRYSPSYIVEYKYLSDELDLVDKLNVLIKQKPSQHN